MKKVLLLALGLLLTGGVTVAKPVGADVARSVAEAWMHSQGMTNITALVDVTTQTPFTEFYVFAAPEGGFVLVSADDCVQPVLGYSLTNRFETKEIPEHVLDWLKSYEEEIRGWKTSPRNGTQCTTWELLVSGEAPEPLLATAISPLMTTTWNQEPYYNNLCPYDDDYNTRVVTGCVATATAQIMKYWNHPTTGYGSHSYHAQNDHSDYGTLSANFGATTYAWSNMPNSLNGGSSSAQVDAIATLMYHVGVANEMAYDVSSLGGSAAYNYNYYGTLNTSSQTSLMKYFKYRPDMYAIIRDDYSDADYCALLRNELDQNRPILYSGGNTSSSHSFVVDGYNTAGLFHINWGWGSSYDGYFVIGSFNPIGGGIGGNSTRTYNMHNVALLGIRPNTDWSTTGSTVISVNSSGNGAVHGDGSYSFGDTVTITAKADDGYRFRGWNDGCKFNPRQLIANGGNYSFTADFEPVTGDTLHYCPGNNNVSSYGGNESISGGSTGTKWGMLLRSSLLPPNKDLLAVQLYVRSAGDYNLTIYTGYGVTFSTVATTNVTFYYGDREQWKTIVLDTPVSTTEDLWIMFSSPAPYPATYTYGSGVAESFIWSGSRVMHGDDWNVTAMIKCIFGQGSLPPEPTQYTVNINRVCSNCSAEVPAGFVTGEGTYPPGTTVLLESLEEGNWNFDYWIAETGDTVFEKSYILYDINSDRNITAVFSKKTGIYDAPTHQLIGIHPNPASNSVNMTVDEEGEALVMDVTGCTVLKQRVTAGTNILNVSSLSNGVYYVKMGTCHTSFIVNH